MGGEGTHRGTSTIFPMCCDDSISAGALDASASGKVPEVEAPMPAPSSRPLPSFAALVDADTRAWLKELTEAAEPVEITERIVACRDPTDDKFLELAVNGHADLIVTGDGDLLALNPFRDIPIVTPAVWCKAPHGRRILQKIAGRVRAALSCVAEPAFWKISGRSGQRIRSWVPFRQERTAPSANAAASR
jgi:hypothetical protein